MSKTLYVTDLDGTLLQNDHTLSNNTITLLNKLLDQGLCFTYATSRSIHTAAPITQSLHITLPVITRDGCVIADTQKRIEIDVKKILFQKIISLLPIFSPIIHSGFMTAYTQGRESKLYLQGEHSQGFQNYLNEHHNDPNLHSILTLDRLFQNDICYFNFIANREDLEPIYKQIKDDNELSCIFQKDNYNDSYWLNVYPCDTTKGSAVQKLKRDLNCDRLVVFGDSVNDISMFEVADVSYAMANAIDELKHVATDIIGDNDSDSVARWLIKNY